MKKPPGAHGNTNTGRFTEQTGPPLKTAMSVCDGWLASEQLLGQMFVFCCPPLWSEGQAPLIQQLTHLAVQKESWTLQIHIQLNWNHSQTTATEYCSQQRYYYSKYYSKQWYSSFQKITHKYSRALPQRHTRNYKIPRSTAKHYSVPQNTVE